MLSENKNLIFQTYRINPKFLNDTWNEPLPMKKKTDRFISNIHLTKI